MHQHPRPPPRTASPATSEQTNPMRSNNSRDRPASTQASGSSEDFITTRQEPDTNASMQRLNQVIQNFHTKAALIILHSRAELSPAYSSKTNEKRVNKWFNIELDETDDYLDEIKKWKRIDIQLERPAPLIIEVYLTTDTLPQGQRLVVLDEDQKRWDVYNSLDPKNGAQQHSQRSERSRELLLERWTVGLGEQVDPIPSDLATILPHVYKKSIILFRTLYTYCNFLPTYKLLRKLGKSRSTMGLKIDFRIVDGDKLDSISRADNLTTPLFEDSSNVTTDYSFGNTDSPAGPFSVQVKYRSNCDFRVENAEELLSSRFTGIDDEFFRAPIRQEREDGTQQVGSLPTDHRRNLVQRPELGQAYGSMTTFHEAGINPNTNPIETLRAQRPLGSDSPSPPRTLPQQSQFSRPAAATSSTTRRSSFSIQPFKTPTLAASPLGSSPLGASPRVATRVVPTLGSLEEEPTSDQRSRLTVAPSSDNTQRLSPSGSPKPAPVQRFQSSFSHRRNRLSIDRTTSRADDDQNSSGKASAASSAQPGSGLMTEAGKEDSSGSLHTDDENISDFLKMLDQKKDLLTPTSAAALETSAKKTAVAIDRFRKMRESNAALSESMSSSLVVPKSSPPSARQAGQPAISTSTSPGAKPVSPHTPHTPFAPSRLSAAYNHDDPELQEGLQADGAASPAGEQVVTENDPDGSRAINIPNSPIAFKPGYRRSSSAQRRPIPSEDDIGDLYGMKSASMGANLRHQPSATEEPRPLNLNARRESRQTSHQPQAEGNVSDSGSARSSLHTTYRSRFARTSGTRGGSHASPTQGSLSSIGGTGASVGKTGDSESVSGSWGRSKAAKPESKTGEDEDEFPFLMDASFSPSKKETQKEKKSE